MLIDGKAIAKTLLEQVKNETKSLPRLTMTAITCAPNFETQKYLEMKKKRSAAAGISLNVIELPKDVNTEQMVECVAVAVSSSDGVVVQLPLPDHIDKDLVLKTIPKNKDVDVFSYGEKNDRILPPVVGALDEISKVYKVEWKNKKVVVLGKGALVGLPAARYARKRGAKVRVYEDGTFDQTSLKTAEIIISGIGQPNFVTAEMVSQGVIIFDAGTSEEGGILMGDVHPGVAEKAHLLTPVPGGIGPITIAYLLRNLVTLSRQ